MNKLDERLRASDPSHPVDAPEHVLAAILAEPEPEPEPARRPARQHRRRLVIGGAVGTACCAAVVLGIALPGGGGSAPSFAARAYAQTAPAPVGDQIVHVVEHSTADVGDIHQVETTESWQQGVRWHLTTSTTESGGRDFSDVEEQLFDGDVIRSWFSKAPPQTLRASDGGEAKQIIERSRLSPLDRFRAAYEDQQLTDLGVVDFEGRRAHAYRTTLRDTGHHGGPPVFVGSVATFFFDPQTAVPVGSTLESDHDAGPNVTNVISTWEQLAPTPENLRRVTERG